MNHIIKTQSKAEAEEAQRRYFWSLTPYERVTLAMKLNRQARAIYSANPRNRPVASVQENGRRVIKSTTPMPRDRH